jgi:hypothetical protein
MSWYSILLEEKIAMKVLLQLGPQLQHNQVNNPHFMLLNLMFPLI